VVYNSNPVAVAPESAKVVQGFAREDLFTVVLEHFLTDTADHADYVLPATTQLEHWDVHASLRPHLRAGQPAGHRAAGQARSNTADLPRAGGALGFTEPCFGDSDEQRWPQAFKPEWVDFAGLHARGLGQAAAARAPFADGGFPTPTAVHRSACPASACPTIVPNHECAESRLSSPRATRWR
jgi:anaerobic selenocysteine-containing dehydrogenase